MSLIVVGINHRTAPVEVRERFAIPETTIPSALRSLRVSGTAEEVVILSTCNRVELYATSRLPPHRAGKELREFLARSAQASTASVESHFYTLQAGAGLEHLFKVASGLDSLVLGETEILGQLKLAYNLALEQATTGRLLNKSFQQAFNVAKQIRTQTQIQRGSTSVGSVAVELAEKLFADLANCEVLVIGAGDTSEKTARALQSRGAKGIIVANRSFDRASILAQELGGRAVRFEDWEREFDRLDIVISSTAAPHYILDRPKLEHLLRHRPQRPMMLIDIAVPRDIDPKVDQLENVYLYDIDDLQMIAADYLEQRKLQLSQCEAIIRARATTLLSTLGQTQPWVVLPAS